MSSCFGPGGGDSVPPPLAATTHSYYNRERWKFPVNLEDEVRPVFCHKALSAMVGRLGCSDRARVDRVLGYLRMGADIGCKGIFRCSTSSSNASSAYESGREVTDAIAGWIADGYAYGPVEEGEVPAEAKVSGIMVKKKPNGAARVILNL